MKWLRILSMTCDEATHLASQSLDRELSCRQRLALRVHVLYCVGCRRFQAQLRVLRQAVQQRLGAAGVDSLTPSTGLSPEARERIKRALSTLD